MPCGLNNIGHLADRKKVSVMIGFIRVSAGGPERA